MDVAKTTARGFVHITVGICEVAAVVLAGIGVCGIVDFTFRAIQAKFDKLSESVQTKIVVAAIVVGIAQLSYAAGVGVGDQ